MKLLNQRGIEMSNLKRKGELCFSEAIERGKNVKQADYCNGMNCAKCETCEALNLFNVLPRFAPNFDAIEAQLKNRYPHLVYVA